MHRLNLRSPVWLAASVLLLAPILPARAADPLPDAPPPPTPEFGVDLAAGYGGGAVLAEWAVPGVGGYAWIEAGAYPQSRSIGGPRVGATAWATLGIAPKQDATELADDVQRTFAFAPRAYGLAASIRYDPAARWSGTFDLGFGRMDLEDYFGGPQAIPVFNLRAGLHRRLGPGFVDAAARTTWGEARAAAGGLSEWWTVGAELGYGFHVR